MDLYQPLYVARPVVAPETFASLRPQVHNQDLAAAEEQFLRAGQQGAIGGRHGRRHGRRNGAEWAAGWVAWAAVAWAADGGHRRRQLASRPARRSIRRPASDRPAQGDDVGELFRYQIDEPVKLARQQSAMLPIVNDTVKGEKVSLYNPAVQAKHPLNAVQLVNTTRAAFDARSDHGFRRRRVCRRRRIEDLAPGGRRLISYALDLDTEITVEKKSSAWAIGQCPGARRERC